MPRTVLSTSLLTLGGLVAALGLTAVAIWHFARPESLPNPGEPPPTPDPPTPDPRLVFDTPFRNVKPGVGYVGDAVCDKCHPGITESYHKHPMGRSAEYLSAAIPLEKYHPSGRTVFTTGAFDLEVEKSADGVRHRVHLRGPSPVPVPDAVLPVQLVIGSGTRGRSYLTVDRGYVWQTPVSWFGPDQKWDVSPGFRLGQTVRRPIAPACLYCHVDRVEPASGVENHYREPLFAHQAAIGCERCHGPGELHAAERRNNAPAAPDTTIVNPRYLSPALQLAICEQCHLQGEERVTRRGRDIFEYRPGLPFDHFVSVYVRHPDIAEANRSVGQFEQMEQSRCFAQSGGHLTCTSCHDPHLSPAPAARDAHYRQRCLNCHEGPGLKGCALPPAARREKGDSCVACHMQKAASANIAHASVTDHRVPRTGAPRPAPQGLAPGTVPLVRFRSGSLLPPEELERDLGIALARFGKKPLPKELAAGGDVRLFALDRLKTSLARWPGDAEAWGALAGARSARGEAAEKLKAAAAAAQLAPDSEAVLLALTEAATSANEYDLAEETAGRCVRLNPTASEPLVVRAFVSLKRGDWTKAEADCRAALRIHPHHPESHLYLAICLHQQGDPAAGLREARTAAQLESDPRERAYLMDWYQRATR
jgi:predicted CXXCH cytochrome family protein